MSIKLNKNRAFSLIELISSISIIAIIYSYSFLELHSLYYKLNQQLYVFKIKNFIEFAQAKAFYSKNLKILVENNIIRLFDNDTYKKKLVISKKYKINIPDIKDKFINFYSTGVQTPFRIELTSVFYKCSIITSLRGRIRSECRKVQ